MRLATSEQLIQFQGLEPHWSDGFSPPSALPISAMCLRIRTWTCRRSGQSSPPGRRTPQLSRTSRSCAGCWARWNPCPSTIFAKPLLDSTNGRAWMALKLTSLAKFLLVLAPTAAGVLALVAALRAG